MSANRTPTLHTAHMPPGDDSDCLRLATTPYYPWTRENKGKHLERPETADSRPCSGSRWGNTHSCLCVISDNTESQDPKLHEVMPCADLYARLTNKKNKYCPLGIFSVTSFVHVSSWRIVHPELLRHTDILFHVVGDLPRPWSLTSFRLLPCHPRPVSRTSVRSQALLWPKNTCRYFTRLESRRTPTTRIVFC